MRTTIVIIIRGIRSARFVLPLLLLCLSIAQESIAQSFWQPTTGPNRADLRALAINSREHIFAASYGGGISRSMDNGDSWTAINNGLTNMDVRVLAINSSGHIFAGTGGGGIFRSMDNGTNWTAQNSGLSNLNISAFAINSSGNIFAGTNGGGIFRSLDNGESWAAINSGLGSLPRAGALAINARGEIFAGIGTGVYLSTTNGASWTRVGGSTFFGTVLALAINASGHIFAGGEGGVKLSTNNGNSWTDVNNGLPITDIVALSINSSGHIFWSGGSTFHSATSGRGIYRSTTNGVNWAPINSGLTDLDVGALAINSSGRIFAGTYGGVVFRSLQSTIGIAPNVTTNAATNVSLTSATLNGTVNPNDLSTAVKFEYGATGYDSEITATPSPVNGASTVLISAALTGLSSNTLYYYRAVGINSAGTIRGADQTFTTSASPNQNFWQQTNGPNAADLRALAINSSGHVFTASYGGGIFRSMDNGDIWTAINSGLTNMDVRVLAINSSGHIFAGTGGGGIFRSMDNGTNWTAQNSGLSNLNISAFAINSSGNIFAGTNGGGIFRSLDNGESWAAINSGLGSLPRAGALAINARGEIFAGIGTGVYLSTTNGASWTRVGGSTFFGTVLALAINASGHIFAGGEGGVKLSTNNGNSWTDVNNGLPITDIVALSINSSGHIFWSGGSTFHSATSGRGIYRSTTNGVNWAPINSGLTDLDVGALAINSSGRIFAGTYSGVVFRSVQSIEGVAPSVTTNTATNVTSTSATLNGTVNPNSLSTVVTFQYGTTTSYGNEINATQNPVSGTNAVSVSAALTGLSPNTLYHYRAIGTNNAGTTNGANQMFTTLAPNRLPVVADTIPNQTLTIGGPSFTRDLNASPVVFTDPDGDALTYTTSSSATNIATASISGATLTVAPMAAGIATITVTANDGRGGTASTTFTVTVGNIINRLPVVANAISNQTLTTGGVSFTRNLNAPPAVFSDPDGDALTYTASSSATGVATASISGSTLTVAPVAAGNATITITANDGRGGTVSTTFMVTVSATNRPPVVVNAISNQNLTVSGASFVRDLNATLPVFSDPDGDALIYTVNSSATSVATASVSISTLTVAPVAGGSATITVTANDGRGGIVSTNFTATVTAANRPPVVANAVSNQTLTVGGASFVRDLNAALAVFSDPDGDALIYTVNSSAASVATASVSISTLTVTPVAAGSATITVTANDGRGGTVSTNFTVTVTAANRPPVVANAISNQTLTIGGSSFTRNLNASPAVFSDPDGDALNYTASSSLQNIATASISGSTLTISPVSGGVSTITVTANDGRGGMVSTTFIVTINRPPVLANPIANQTLTVGEASFTRDLNVSPVVFSDPDGDALAYSPSSNAINIATVNISGTVLTVAPVAAGNATITVTANDGRGGIVLTNFTVTVRAANRPPVVANTISNQNLTVGGVSFVRDLNAAQAVFNDPDGDALIYAANSSATNVATASVSISTLRVEPMAVGSATITVTANDGRGGTISTSFSATINLPSYPSSLNLNTTVTYPSHPNASDYPATDYRIIGIPGASNQLVTTVLSLPLAQQDKNWQVYWDNGAASNFFVAFDGSTNFQFSVGRAFWIINKGTANISTTSPSAPLNNLQEIELPLPNSGWNLITNPFTTSVAWSKIQSANNVTEPIYAFNSSFSTATSFDPYSGYYFFNATNLSKLKIPYALYFSSTPVAEVDPAIWRVNISFSSGEISDQSTSFGIANEASPDLDRFDFRKPRALAATPTVEFKRPTWDAKYSIFATDIRPKFEESESWEFDVRAISRQPAQLIFTGISKIPSRFEVYLIDADHAQSLNLREDSLYHFTPAAELMKFKVVVGRKESVQEQLSALVLPKEFALGPNYPNPFSANGTFGNPTTAIPIAVPAASEIKLKIYNLLGAEVKTLYEGTIEAGRYWFNWDGRNELGNNVAAGVYLFRLTTNKKVSLLGKMILIR